MIGAPASRGDNSAVGPDTDVSNIHRVKIIPRQFLVNALVARPVRKDELAVTPKAQEAMDAEWNRLLAAKVWDTTNVREWDDVAAEAVLNKKEVQFGYLFGICVEKGSELPKGDKGRKFKGRVVFQGNRVEPELGGCRLPGSG